MTDATEKGKKVGIQTYPNAHAGGEYRTKAAKGGRIKAQFGYNSGRTNLLEEVGRVEGERSNPNRRAEIGRLHSELNKGYKKGGSVAKKGGGIIKGNKGMGVAK